MLVATHLLEDAEAVADRIIVIDDGTIVWNGTATELSQQADAEHNLAGLRSGFHTVIRSRP